MLSFLLFFSTAVIGTFLLASGAVTAALGISVVMDRVDRKRTQGSGAVLCESAGIVLSMFGFVWHNTDPFHAHHAMIIGALLIALGMLIRPAEDREALHPLLRRAQIGQYAGALASMTTLAVFSFTAAIIG